jgi:hypothetical protein
MLKERTKVDWHPAVRRSPESEAIGLGWQKGECAWFPDGLNGRLVRIGRGSMGDEMGVGIRGDGVLGLISAAEKWNQEQPTRQE